MMLNPEVLRVPGMIEATLHTRAGQVRELFQASFHTIHHPSASQPGTDLIAFPAAWSIFTKRPFRSGGGWDLQRYCAPTHQGTSLRTPPAPMDRGDTRLPPITL
jgi:hypothetical protein